MCDTCYQLVIDVLNCLVAEFVWRWFCVFFFQAEDGIRDLVRSRGLGDVYKRQVLALRPYSPGGALNALATAQNPWKQAPHLVPNVYGMDRLLYTSDAADERSSVDLGGRRFI